MSFAYKELLGCGCFGGMGDATALAPLVTPILGAVAPLLAAPTIAVGGACNTANGTPGTYDSSYLCQPTPGAFPNPLTIPAPVTAYPATTYPMPTTTVMPMMMPMNYPVPAPPAPRPRPRPAPKPAPRPAAKSDGTATFLVKAAAVAGLLKWALL